MAVCLKKGQKVDLTKSNPGLKKITVGLGWDVNRYDGPEFDLDASAFLLAGNGRVSSDGDFVFYNNLSGRDGAVVHMGDNLTGGSDGDDEQIRIDFTKLPPKRKKIAICVTIYDADLRRQNFGQVSNAYIKVSRLASEDDEVGETVLRFDLEEEFSIETALVVAEIYNKNGEWKFNAVAAGYQGGLAAICRSFGANV